MTVLALRACLCSNCAALGGVIASLRPRTNSTGHCTFAIAASPPAYESQATKPRWNTLTCALLASTRFISARAPPYNQVPGPSADGGGASMECEYVLTMSI